MGTIRTSKGVRHFEGDEGRLPCGHSRKGYITMCSECWKRLEERLKELEEESSRHAREKDNHIYGQ